VLLLGTHCNKTRFAQICRSYSYLTFDFLHLTRQHPNHIRAGLPSIKRPDRIPTSEDRNHATQSELVAASSHIYVVTHNKAVDSVYASAAAANERAAAMKAQEGEAGSIKVELHELKGGSVQVPQPSKTTKPLPEAMRQRRRRLKLPRPT
jgi:hypothetical protein